MAKQRWSLLVVALTACGDPVSPPQPLEIVTAGRLERGAEISIALLEGTDTVAGAQVTWTAQPASAVQQVGPGRIRLIEAAQVVLTARHGERTTSVTLTVAVPPILVLDLVREGNRDLYAVALDGGDLRRLTTSAADDRSPTVAGNRIIFVSYRNGNGELYSTQVGGAPGSEVRLTQTAANEETPALSPNGQRLAFERSAGQLGKVWVAAVDDLANAQLAAGSFGGPAALEASPVWARNDLLVLLSTASFDADLYTISSPPGMPAELVRAPGPQVDPAASADGTRVVYAANSESDLELHVVDIANRQTRVLLRRPGTDSRAAFLADGRVAFLALDPAPVRLYWFDPAQAVPTLHEIPVGTGLTTQTRLAPVR